MKAGVSSHPSHFTSAKMAPVHTGKEVARKELQLVWMWVMNRKLSAHITES
jgi:hypothetical protein